MSNDSSSFSPSDFCVIAAIDNPDVLSKCLAMSPDIQLRRMPLITITGASSMADAYNQGLGQTDARICLLAHQDVYLPAGWLDKAVATLNELTARHPNWMVAGPYGIRADGQHVGRVWDVTMKQELGGPVFEPTAVGSFDELLLILRRRGDFWFDPNLPHFHLYGTDLVQTALSMGYSAWAVELPVVHNNRPIGSLRGGYLQAYKYARRKWRRQLPIYTSICALTYNPFPLWRSQWRRRNDAPRDQAFTMDSVEIAKMAGYE